METNIVIGISYSGKYISPIDPDHFIWLLNPLTLTQKSVENQADIIKKEY